MKTALPTVAFTVLLSLALQAQAGPFSNMVIFGDSHSDVGNWYAVHKVEWPPPYYQNRSSNGPLWVDQLAEQLDLPPLAPSGAQGLDYAWAGARTGAGTDHDGQLAYPRVGEQINQYLREHQPRDDELFVLFAGHNDFGAFGQTRPAVPVANLSSYIQTLAANGAQHILVPNLHPLGYLPAYRGTSREATLNERTSEFNALLAEELTKLEHDLAIDIYPVDFHGVVEQAIADPASLGLSNITGKALLPDNGVVSNPDQFLYWDDHHFTTAAYGLLAQEAARSVPEPSGIVLAALAVLAMTGGHVLSALSRAFGRKLR